MTTRISWTEETWNPVTGCDRISTGCNNCYAMKLAARLKAMGQPRYQNDGDPRTSGPGFGVTCHADALNVPLRWRKPRRVFVNSMSDLFHPGIPAQFVESVFDVMSRADHHTFQVLTKRPSRMEKVVNAWGRPEPPPNVWLGVSVENQRYAKLRIPPLIATPAAVRFLSVEPLLGPVDISTWLHGGIDWVICGGESGPRARPMAIEWAEDLVTQCKTAGVAVFVKQLGTVTGGRSHHDIETFPPSLQVREYPTSTMQPNYEGFIA